jgi:hypothetical protein
MSSPMTKRPKRPRPGAGTLGTGGYRPGDGLAESQRFCLRVRNEGRDARECDQCGNTPALLHVPLRRRGAYCASCCVECRAAG